MENVPVNTSLIIIIIIIIIIGSNFIRACISIIFNIVYNINEKLLNISGVL